jgi:Chlorophyll A-B binding protein
MQEAEIRHARLAMLAVVGWPLSELVAPEWMLQNGCAPSVLNGFNPVSFIATIAAFGALGFFEFKTSLRRVDDKEFGVIHAQDMQDVWKWGVAGD